MRPISILFLSLLLCACGKTKENTATAADSLKSSPQEQSNGEKEIDYFRLETYLVPEVADTSKVQVIDEDCALAIWPTDEQIEEMKKENEEDFAVIADDASYYQYLSSKNLDSLSIKTISASENRLIKFVGETKSWTLNVRQKDLPAWNLILFKRNKTPEVTSTAGLTYEKLQEYFQK